MTGKDSSELWTVVEELEAGAEALTARLKGVRARHKGVVEDCAHQLIRRQSVHAALSAEHFQDQQQLTSKSW